MSTTKLPDSCPFCEAAVTTMSNGKPCRSAEGMWVAFECLTSLHAGQDQRSGQSRPCEAAERTRLADEVARLRRDEWVGGACLHLLEQHGVSIGSPELLEAKARVEAEMAALRTANAALVERVSRLEEARTLAAANSLANMLTHEDALAKIQALIREGNKLEAIVRRDYGGAYCDEWTKAKGQG